MNIKLMWINYDNQKYFSHVFFLYSIQSQIDVSP